MSQPGLDSIFDPFRDPSLARGLRPKPDSPGPNWSPADGIVVPKTNLGPTWNRNGATAPSKGYGGMAEPSHDPETHKLFSARPTVLNDVRATTTLTLLDH